MKFDFALNMNDEFLDKEFSLSVAFFVKDRRREYLYDEQSFCKQIQAPPENLNHMQKV